MIVLLISGSVFAAESDPAALVVGLEMAGDLRQTLPDLGLSRELVLSRGVAELALRDLGPAGARLRIEPARSGGDTGYIGIEGESIVPRIQIAEASLRGTLLGEWRLSAGLVDEPWVASAEGEGLPRSVAAPLAEEQGLLFRSDLGGLLGWTSPHRYVDVVLGLHSGEGLAQRERNDGQNLLAMVTVRPLAASDPEALQLSVFGREGSRGLALVRDHRAGLRVQGGTSWIGGGAEALAGWGLEADGSVEPGAAGAWVVTGRDVPALGWVRVDHGRFQRALPETATTTWRLGGGPAFAWGEDLQAAWLVAGLEHHRFAEEAAPLAGAGSAANHTVLFLQLGTGLSAEIPLSTTP